jgi:hypothetical protein
VTTTAPSTPPVAPPTSWSPDDEAPPADGPSGAAALISERPEVAVGAAFAGGLILAQILKRLGR